MDPAQIVPTGEVRFGSTLYSTGYQSFFRNNMNIYTK